MVFFVGVLIFVVGFGEEESFINYSSGEGVVVRFRGRTGGRVFW